MSSSCGGIAKTHMIQACYRLGITVMEKCFTLDDLKNADENYRYLLLQLLPACLRVDGQPAGGKDPPMLKAIQDGCCAGAYLHRENHRGRLNRGWTATPR